MNKFHLDIPVGTPLVLEKAYFEFGGYRHIFPTNSYPADKYPDNAFFRQAWTPVDRTPDKNGMIKGGSIFPDSLTLKLSDDGERFVTIEEIDIKFRVVIANGGFGMHHETSGGALYANFEVDGFGAGDVHSYVSVDETYELWKSRGISVVNWKICIPPNEDNANGAN